MGYQGLNRNYLSQIEMQRRSQVISLTLQLTSFDYLNLFEPTGYSASIRSSFHFTLQGESFKTILQSIESYNPETGVARCKFLTID